MTSTTTTGFDDDGERRIREFLKQQRDLQITLVQTALIATGNQWLVPIAGLAMRRLFRHGGGEAGTGDQKIR